MSGIFRNSVPNTSNETTPHKRFSLGAFCASPGTLQDVTMDTSYGIGYRSPCVSLQQYQGPTSPACQGRSVREFEDQMASLRKENFNLKLRLYFMEESIPGYNQAVNASDSNSALAVNANGSGGQETLMKQLIDAKVEMEMLRKEVQDKQDILKDAAQAMTHMENLQKESEEKSQVIIDQLKEKLQFLEMGRNAVQGENCLNDLLGHVDVDNTNTVEKIRDFEAIISQQETKIKELQLNLNKWEHTVSKRDETIKEYEDKVKELAFQNADLIETLDKKHEGMASVESQKWRKELQECKSELADKTCMLQDTEQNLAKRTELYETACRFIQKLMRKAETQQDQIAELKGKKKRNASVASLVVEDNETTVKDGSAVCTLECTGQVGSRFSDTEVSRRTRIVPACSTNSCKSQCAITISQQSLTIKTLEEEIKQSNTNIQKVLNRELWEKNKEIERLQRLLNSKPATMATPTSQTVDVASETGSLADRCEFLKRMVQTLSARLHASEQNETAVIRLRSELAEARSDLENAEKWRVQCADICSILVNRLQELAGFLNSLLLYKNVISELAVDRRMAMRKAVDRSLDLSKNLNRTLSISMGGDVSDHLTDSHNFSVLLNEIKTCLQEISFTEKHNETFNSHEDLTSVKPMHITDDIAQTFKKDCTKKDEKKDRRSIQPLAISTGFNAEQQSESEWSEPDRMVSMARIGLEESRSAGPPALDLPHTVDSDSEDATKMGATSNVGSRTARIIQLEQMVMQRDENISKLTARLASSGERIKRLTRNVQQTTQEMKVLKNQNERIHADLLSMQEPLPAKSMEQTILVRQLEESKEALEKMQAERDKLSMEARMAAKQISALKTDNTKQEHELETARLRANEHERQHIEALRAEMEATARQQLEEQTKRHQDVLKREFVTRTAYEDIRTQLMELQRQHSEALRSIDGLSESASDLKQALLEGEQVARSLKKQLDESTLQASKAVLERTKASKENMELDRRVEELQAQLKELIAERDELLVQLASAERMPNDEASPSGYSSADMHHIVMKTSPNMAARNGGDSRKNISSPDLGISSDAGGRTSNEITKAQRMMLQTVEVNMDIATMTSVAVSDSNVKENVEPNMTSTVAIPTTKSGCTNCVKVEQENFDLRRKLTRTKRALIETYEKLRCSNQRKAQVEKDIKNQILKTHNVLKNVRSNMENEL